MEGRPIRRNRGVSLSASGIQRLSQAISAFEMAENNGNRFTIEELSDRTNISTSTLSRLWASKAGVDRRTLRLLFSAFSLNLQDSDLLKQDAPSSLDGSPTAPTAHPTSPIKYPSGPVPLGSPRYIKRQGVDDRALQEISHPGSVVRIQAPTGYGKTSLLLRILHKAQQQGYATARIDLQQVDHETLVDTPAFLQWFCTALAHALGKPPQLDAYWDEALGSKLSTTLYLRQYVLADLQRPLLLAISRINQLFEYRETAQEVLPLFRSWHEEAQQDRVWQHLRLVIAYSTDMYLPLDINQSPFNIGLPIRLPGFTREQVQTLAEGYQVAWEGEACDRLLSLIGGNPYLINVALYHLQDGMSFDVMLREASTPDGIYRTHLQRLLAQLNANPQWLQTLEPLIQQDEAQSIGITMNPMLAYKLAGLGLIQPGPGQAGSGLWQFSCHLYHRYLKH